MKSLRVRTNEGTWRAVRTPVLISLTSGQGDFRLKTVKLSWPERQGIYWSARREHLLYNKALVMASDGNNIALCTTVFSDYNIPWYLHSTPSPRYSTLNNTIVLPPLQKKSTVVVPCYTAWGDNTWYFEIYHGTEIQVHVFKWYCYGKCPKYHGKTNVQIMVEPRYQVQTKLPYVKY